MCSGAGSSTEIDSVRASEQVADNGLVISGRIEFGGRVAVEIEPLAFGAIRLEAPDGRISLFPRAMCRVRATDGRLGLGWVEWNRNQPSA